MISEEISPVVQMRFKCRYSGNLVAALFFVGSEAADQRQWVDFESKAYDKQDPRRGAEFNLLNQAEPTEHLWV